MVNEKRSGRKQIPSTPGSSGSTGSQAFDTRPYLPNSIAVPAVIPSGSLNLDFALGIGGIPRSHITAPTVGSPWTAGARACSARRRSISPSWTTRTRRVPAAPRTSA